MSLKAVSLHLFNIINNVINIINNFMNSNQILIISLLLFNSYAVLLICDSTILI